VDAGLLGEAKLPREADDVLELLELAGKPQPRTSAAEMSLSLKRVIARGEAVRCGHGH
jgi:hypothetical protein